MFEIRAVAGFRNLQGRFTKADAALLKDRRESVRILGRKWVSFAQDEAPKGPASTGRFWRGIRFRTFISGGTIGFKAYSPQPLGKWIIGGTKPHRIPKDKRPPGKPLYFFWPRGGGKYYTRYSVRHPGTKPNPYHKRATKRWLPEARKELNRVATRWVTTAAKR